ncbi:hypothetical protein ACCAA_330003 [Candidatus Accumulibacter aalborgensis]|uniref:Uncharacterized protein n=1 Tax=Candidatus Accumulibacter aalborgensis TaxID=1860102 RepID=A0A1A8XP35_9PROT|nr:hypothetical protein ACCAA_330003 [Candidatus Accumulibacter aalborgensis]
MPRLKASMTSALRCGLITCEPSLRTPPGTDSPKRQKAAADNDANSTGALTTITELLSCWLVNDRFRP